MTSKHVLASLMVWVLCFLPVANIAQSTNVLPSSGDVGIGTTNPVTPLHVIGESTLQGNTVVTGTVDIQSDLKLTSLVDTAIEVRPIGVAADGTIKEIGSSTAHFHYLIVDSAIKVGDSSINFVYSTPNTPYNQIFSTAGPLYINFSAAVPENLYLTHPSAGQVGIGYAHTMQLPATSKFAVRGNSHFSGFNGINAAIIQGTRLGVQAGPNETAVDLVHLQQTPHGYSFRDVVSHPQTKAITVVQSDNNPATTNDPETFQVLGNGITNIGAGSYQLISQVNIQTALDAGCRVKTTNTNPGKYAYIAEVPRNDAKAFTVINNVQTNSPREAFIVQGDGETRIGSTLTNINQAQLKVESTNPVGCHVKNSNNWSYVGNTNTAILADVAHDDAKAISVVRSLPGQPVKETFKVTGSGVAWMQEVRVRVAPFPDYVFEKDYPLMSLDSLEQFIGENHRLPGMPSASEVAENDANLGELVRLQQEKIEELTLYLIEMKKRIAAIENDEH